MLKDVKYIYI